jgi:hypothetical protein
VLPFREMIKGVEGAWAWEKEKVKGYLKWGSFLLFL